MGLCRGAVWCGVKREVHKYKECLGVPGFQDILRFRTCSNPERRVILAPFQWNCRQLFLFGDHTAKKGAKTTVGVPALQPAVYNSHDALLYYLCGGPG